LAVEKSGRESLADPTQISQDFHLRATNFLCLAASLIA